MSSQEVETLLQLEVVLFKQILFGENLVSKRKLLLLLQATDDELPLMMPTAAPVPISHGFVTKIAPICAIELILTSPPVYFTNPSQTISSEIPLQFCSSLTAKLSLFLSLSKPFHSLALGLPLLSALFLLLGQLCG
jgi:hypothetical protein